MNRDKRVGYLRQPLDSISHFGLLEDPLTSSGPVAGPVFGIVDTNH